ncbi:MAG: rRNA pseudouridine synthase [Clostridia bacterium]|nr:rRNA pseudouridine synthase [Clostridia bacterium]
MRIDKLLSVCSIATRSESGRAARAGRITVNGVAERNAARQIDTERDEVCFDGARVIYREHVYIMLNKPEGYVSATEDGRDPTVLELLPDEVRRAGMFPCGRLDKNTLGLMLLTDDGELAHRLLAPKRHVEKRYRFVCRNEVSEADRQALETGLQLADGYMTKPAAVELFDDRKSGIITLHEGKYHQIKRMFGAVNDNRIIHLERITFGPLTLDESLGRGEWRYLDDDEIAALMAAGNL